MEVTSDSVYNGIPPNTSLNNIFKVKQWNTYDAYAGLTLDSVKQLTNKGYQANGLILFSIKKPTDSHGHKFTLTIQTEDNKITTTTTKRIYWY